MNNYKIRVNNKAESREAQELFFEISGKWINSEKRILEYDKKMPFFYLDGERLSKGQSIRSFIASENKELTLPQLRDLVAQSKSKEQGLISGAEALRALADGEEVLHIAKSAKHLGNDFWSDATKNFTIHDFLSGSWVFRLKPRTVKLEIEVPAPFEPKVGDVFYILSPTSVGGYAKAHITDQKRMDAYAKLGAWRTEDEIKIVVEQLRKLKENSK